jgi:hypothetical protein
MASSLPLIRRALVPLALIALAACQSGLETGSGAGGGRLPDPAARAQMPEAPAVASIDPDACWAQARVTRSDGAAEDRLFAVPCPGSMTPVLWSSVQRALAVRGLYSGPITGTPDAATGEAVRRFQAPLGLDSPVLSLDGARHLGLMPWPRDRL